MEKNFIKTEKKFYSLGQIFLHWTIALLVFYQLVNNKSIGEEYEIFLINGKKSIEMDNNVLAHIVIGFIILLGMICRLFLRLKTKVPPLPSQMPTLLKLVARSSHFLLYFFLFSMPITGIISWFFEIEPAMILHVYFSKILLVLILFHISAALFHEGVLGNKILQRILFYQNNFKR